METKALQTAVVGVTGYAGMELARLLLHHPCLAAQPPVFAGRLEDGRESVPLTEIHPQLGNNRGAAKLQVEPFRWELFAERGVELIFFATPHEQSRSWVPQALAQGMRVIDLSGAWRLNHAANRAVYNFDEPTDAPTRLLLESLQRESVYGMPELLQGDRDLLRNARLVANPGCYATSIILALRPLVDSGWLDLNRGIVCDSKSGVSGAGKVPSAKTHFMYAADNLSAYALFNHRHTGELLEQLGLENDQITFTPHLLPIPRGILSTIYLGFNSARTAEEIDNCYREFFVRSPMVRLRGTELPQIQYVAHTNFCDIGFQLSSDGRRGVIVSCLDNLLKGAAGQAVQNMNRMYGWDEAEGLA